MRVLLEDETRFMGILDKALEDVRQMVDVEGALSVLRDHVEASLGTSTQGKLSWRVPKQSEGQTCVLASTFQTGEGPFSDADRGPEVPGSVPVHRLVIHQHPGTKLFLVQGTANWHEDLLGAITEAEALWSAWREAGVQVPMFFPKVH